MATNRETSTPLVSFIIAYHELPAELLCACLDSLLALALDPQERQIIVVDDGSAESPLPALADYANQLLYLRQEHQGLSVARNTGLRMATGCYLQFVDADDQLIKAGYDACIDLIRRHPDTDMVLFDFDTQLPAVEAQQSATLARSVQPQSGTHYLRHHNIHGMACGYLFRSAILGDLRFAPGIYHEDELFTPQLLLRAEVVYPTSAKAYYYRQRPHSITNSSDAALTAQRQHDALQVMMQLYQIADRRPKNDQLALQRRVAQLTMDYLYHIIRSSRSLSVTLQHIGTLRAAGLFPLPDRRYTQKYQWFRRLSNSKAGLLLLVRLLPLMKPER